MDLQFRTESKQPKTHSSTWSKIIPMDLKTLQGSKIYVKQLTALAFSCITYMRAIFPESAYRDREIDDVKLKLLSGGYDCEGAYLMTRFIKSAFQALENKYMRELILEILSVDDEPLEYYAVVYKYNDDDTVCSISANSKIIEYDMKVEKSTKDLITTLLSMTEALAPLPEKYKLQLRVNYYDEITPDNYQPKYFHPTNSCNFNELENMNHKAIGEVETPYLSLNMYAGSTLVCLEDIQQTLLNNWNELNQLEGNIKTENNGSTNILEDEGVCKTENTINAETEWTWTEGQFQKEDDPSMQITQKYEESQQEKMNCLCARTYDSELKSDNFKCNHCESFHHLICYKKSPGNKDEENWCCYTCAKVDNQKECTDASLMKYQPHHAKHLAVYRQTLYRLNNQKIVSRKLIENYGIDGELAEKLLTKLNRERFIQKKKNSKTIYVVNKTRLNSFVKTYFEL